MQPLQANLGFSVGAPATALRPETDDLRPKAENPELKSDDDAAEPHVDDRLIRLICIPFFGIAIPHLTGLFGQIDLHSQWRWIGYIYFLGVAAAVWQGNRFLYFAQRRRFNWFRHPIRKVTFTALQIVLFTLPVSAGLLSAWYGLNRTRGVSWESVREAALMIVIAVIFIVQVYETVFLIREREGDRIKAEQLARTKAEAELRLLKGQTDPHFLFNCLNTLSFLIEQDSTKAARFNQNLAEVYRYVLVNRRRDLAPLEEELDFLSVYFSLLEIRFGEAIGLALDRLGLPGDRFLIPPLALQLLLENAVKHNETGVESPLKVSVGMAGEAISVENRIVPKSARVASASLGLKNLDERCRLLTGRGIEVSTDNGVFRVEVPLIRL